MAVIGGLDPSTREPRTITLRPDGSLPMEDVSGDDSIKLLERLIWETCELRRAFCKANKVLFEKYRG